MCFYDRLLIFPSFSRNNIVTENYRKRKHSPDASDERVSSVRAGTDPDTQSASVQEPRASPEDQPASVNTPTEFTCPICLGTVLRLGQTKSLPCSHEFHQSCVDRWLNNKRSCPMCRAPCHRRRTRKPHRRRRQS
ncbi:hypothetical protein AVEN_128952-1 [Araneus ventricosus]|uniref:RING-type E3 ubiquitin transferase n=1 Tax=Araneus ventricosus TaxID=182803 RepID=A0A4Y2QES8_ARAVE|nr:hypothetical protein AVEN_128952-1 [Araneus ventricosus]